MGRSTAQSRLRLAKDKTVPADELTDAHLMALGEFFSYKLCPLTILYYDFSCCAAMCSKRSLNVDTRTLIRWHFDPQSHTELRMRMFMAYVQEWKQISAAVLPSPSDPSSEEAYRCADRLRLSLVPNALELNETAIDSLNEKVKEHSSGTAATGRERARLVLESIGAMGKGSTIAVAGTTTVGAIVEPIIVDADWRAFNNSPPVKTLEAIIQAGLDATTVVHTPLIIKITRSKIPAIIQLLHYYTYGPLWRGHQCYREFPP